MIRQSVDGRTGGQLAHLVPASSLHSHLVTIGYAPSNLTMPGWRAGEGGYYQYLITHTHRLFILIDISTLTTEWRRACQFCNQRVESATMFMLGYLQGKGQEHTKITYINHPLYFNHSFVYGDIRDMNCFLKKSPWWGFYVLDISTHVNILHSVIPISAVGSLMG